VLIDFHTHLRDEPGYAEALAETGQSMGFDYLCIGGDCFGEFASNEQVLAQAETYPDLFVPFASLSLGRCGPQDVRELACRGFRGLRLWAPPAPYDEDRFFPVYEAVQALGLPIVFHTGFSRPTPLDKALDVRCSRMRPVHLDTLARFFPELKIVGVGLGHPWIEEAFEILRLHENVYFDLSGHVLGVCGPAMLGRHFRADKTRLLGNNAGSGACTKLVFGTAVSYEEMSAVEGDYQRFFRSLALRDDVIETVMGGNAASLLALQG